MTKDLAGDARNILAEAATTADRETRRTALRALLIFVPTEKLNELPAGTQ